MGHRARTATARRVRLGLAVGAVGFGGLGGGGRAGRLAVASTVVPRGFGGPHGGVFGRFFRGRHVFDVVGIGLTRRRCGP